MKPKQKTNPPGRIKIMKSFTTLMAEKDFHSITTAEIASNAGVTEGLIYKYFKDKKDLLYQVLGDHFRTFLARVEARVARKNSCIDQLADFVEVSLESYADNRVFSRILLLEVRNSPAYYESVAYQMVKGYSGLLLGIIEDGIQDGELKPGTDAGLLRRVTLGAVEHACLGDIIFGREFDHKGVAAGICNIVLNGVRT
ncbi:MAG: TetR/AcrR family transcriptional regulator [Desulfobacterales bacterium]|nr:TetR/AcrR family transcriptional regulator [Desulfobacterales bacterium]